MTTENVVVGGAIGAVASALTAVLLSIIGGASIGGPPAGAFVVPLLLGALAVAGPQVSRGAWLPAGVGWLVVPFVDHHVLGSVAIHGVAADVAYHVVGYGPVAVSLRRPGRSAERATRASP